MFARVGGVLLTAAAVLCLHLVLSAFHWIVDFAPQTFVSPTWELVGVMFLLLGWAWLRIERPLVGHAFRATLTLVVLLYLILGLGQGFARREFGYDVILALHLPYVPELFRMMYSAEPLGMFLLYLALLFGGLALAIFVIHTSIRRIHTYAAATRTRLIGVAAGFAVFLGATIPFLGIYKPLTAEMLHQIDMAVNLEQRLDATSQKMAVEASRLRRQNPFKRMQKPPSILLFVVESYGRAMFDDPAFEPFQRQAEEIGEELAAVGYHIGTKYLDAPVFGGSSWMADASLLCGVRVHNQRRYESLYASNIDCLPKLLNAAGYRTVMAAGNSTYHEERFNQMFPFHRLYFRDDLQYQGPRFTWSYMPDQYVVQFVHEHEIELRDDKPLFVTYVLTSSHHPWNKIPPYLEDWDKVGDGSVYRRVRGQYFSNRFVTGDQFKPAFMASIRYVMRMLNEYLKRLPDQDTLIIVLGDHQPRKPIARMDKDSWGVPLHVISRNAKLVAQFERLGYTPGMIPDEAAKEMPMEHFLVDLFKAVSAAIR